MNRLLGDDDLRGRKQSNATTIQADPGRVEGVELIEQLAITREPVSR